MFAADHMHVLLMTGMLLECETVLKRSEGLLQQITMTFLQMAECNMQV